MAFSPEELQAYEQIKRLVTRGKHVVEKPVAIVLGGQPGAGKSGLYEIARERFSGNIIELDCDKFRKFHPHSEQLVQDAATYGEKTNPFVFEVVDRLVEELSDQGFNMIIESSMKSSHTAFQNHELLTRYIVPERCRTSGFITGTEKFCTICSRLRTSARKQP